MHLKVCAKGNGFSFPGIFEFARSYSCAVYAVNNVNAAVNKVKDELLNSPSTRVNRTDATFTNVNATALNVSGVVSNKSQVRSTCFGNQSSSSEGATAGSSHVVACEWLCRSSAKVW